VPNPIAARRTGLLWIHILCGGAAGLALMSQANPFSRFVFAPRMTASAAFLALPAVWPYVVSFISSKETVPASHGYLSIYIALLLSVTIAGIWITLHGLGDPLNFGGVLLVSLAQAVVFVVVVGLIRKHHAVRELPNNRWRKP